MKFSGVYIPSVEAKDIYLASLIDNHKGYDLKLKSGEWNLRRFINSLDYSLDLVEIRKIFKDAYPTEKFSFTIKKHEYSQHVINVTFKYSVREWNQCSRNTYVKIGYNNRDLVYVNGLARNESGDIVGVTTDTMFEIEEVQNLPKYFSAVVSPDNQAEYKQTKNFPVLLTNSQLRHKLYNDGFICNGVKYCRAKRSAGSARVGKCLFINEALAKPLLSYSSGSISPEIGDEIDLAAYESYISLTSSSCVGMLSMSADNILIIDDYSSVFSEPLIATRSVGGRLVTTEEVCEVSNSIWDGQSLIDVSAMGEYADKGMVLLRNLMFKSCCFNTNIQKWFRDNNITEISQLNGITRAKNIDDIKLITTRESIKYLKFKDIDDWLDNLYPEFSVVKYDKPTHLFDGRIVQTHYQLLNTVQMSLEETREFLKDSLDFAQMLRDKPEVVRYYIKYPDIDDLEILNKPMLTKNDIVYNMLSVNDDFCKTRYYRDFIHDLLASYYKKIKSGKVYVEGNYSTLLGNPIEMLMQSIGIFNGESQLGVGNVHSTRFDYNKTILCSRSPHISISNVWLPNNSPNDMIDNYFNLTPQIICINSIGENVLQRLAGADFDSDTVLVTDNKHLIKAASKNYNTFKIATSFVEANKIKRYYTPEHQADLDIKTSVNSIGEIINCSQELNSMIWDRMYHGATYEDIKYIYYDICQLSVMSNIEIDKAKKEFDVDNIKELDCIRKKYAAELKRDNKKVLPHFFAHISRQKGYYNSEKKAYIKYHTTMDYVQTIVNSFRIKTPYKKKWLPFTAMIDGERYRRDKVNYNQVENIIEKIQTYLNDSKYIYGFVNITKPEKARRVQLMYDYLVSDINSQVIGYSTMYHLLTTVETRENLPIKNTLMSVLYTCGNKSFNNLVIKSAKTVYELEESGDDIYMFGKGYKRTKKFVGEI